MLNSNLLTLLAVATTALPTDVPPDLLRLETNVNNGNRAQTEAQITERMLAAQEKRDRKAAKRRKLLMKDMLRTPTGRLAQQGQAVPNLQQIPINSAEARLVKEAFRPQEVFSEHGQVFTTTTSTNS